MQRGHCRKQRQPSYRPRTGYRIRGSGRDHRPGRSVEHPAELRAYPADSVSEAAVICLITPVLLSGLMHMIPLCYEPAVQVWIESELVATVG